MSTVFLRTTTESGPRTIVFSASEGDARLLAERLVLDFSTDVPPIVILPERPARASVAQIIVHRVKALDRELASIKRRSKQKSRQPSPAAILNIVRA